MNILVVAAHPDDEVLGCGATMARLSAEGHTVRIAILGEGSTSRADQRDEADLSLVDALAAASAAAAEEVGAAGVSLHGLPDNRFDHVDLLDIVKVVERLIEVHGPTVVFTHHGGDLNVDHRLTHQAVLTATRPVPGQIVTDVYAFEIPSSTEWAFQRYEPVFRPSYFVDVDRWLACKLAAMRCYDAEVRPFPHPRAPEALEVIARRWGTVVGRQAVEAFEVVRRVTNSTTLLFP